MKTASVAAEPIVKEVTVNAPASRVWKAITDKDEMKKWYFDLPDFKPEPGLEFKFWGGDENKQYLHLCRITEVVRGKKITHTWSYPEDDPATTYVSFELFEEGDKTRVRLTHEGIERFSPDNPAFRRENFVAGWDHIIGTALKEYVEKES